MTEKKKTHWSIPLDKNEIDKIDKYRCMLNSKNAIQNKSMTRAEFGRYVFEFWENTFLQNLKDVEDMENEIKKLQDEIEQRQNDILKRVPYKNVS